jgi:hypothetical protein
VRRGAGILLSYTSRLYELVLPYTELVGKDLTDISFSFTTY